MNRDDICSRFLDLLVFDPYPFQEEALLSWFSEGQGLLVTAPTGMGKTLIAEAAIFEALATRTRLYYTTPLIALTDQKFREFQDRAEAWGFDRRDIGLVTGNRRVNPDARVLVVVAEILLNHLLTEPEHLHDVRAVVMDEFHYFNDYDRGVVWELSLVLLPSHVRLMLLSATVGNAAEFIRWLNDKHDRQLEWIRTDERRVPLEFVWVGDKLMTEHLLDMVGDDDATSRVPALVFCFNRDECWAVADRMKGLKLINAEARAAVEERLAHEDFSQGIGPRLRQMLIRGVGVHHAGVLPRHKEVVEDLFLAKHIPFVICTETLAAGINLPARSVVLSTLIKGKPGERKIILSSSAHQMFGRAGRPQFDKKGYVFALAHEDDVRIEKWRRKYEQIDPNSKDPGIMRMRKQLERKRPTRRKTEQYWMEGQFRNLIDAGPGRLASRSMIPYQVLIYLLLKNGRLDDVHTFLANRFNKPERLEGFQRQLDVMLTNLEALGYLTRSEDGHRVDLSETIHSLTGFRSVDPLYGMFLARKLVSADSVEKARALESILPLPPAIARRLRPPFDLPPGPLETNELRPLLIQLGKIASEVPAPNVEDEADDYRKFGPAMWEEEEDAPPVFSEMLKMAFDAAVPAEEPILVQPKWVIGGLIDLEHSFYKFVKNRNLEKQEGLILRHLLRLVILAGEFYEKTEDPAYQEISDSATRTCHDVDPRYTDRFLAEAQERKSLLP